MPAAKKFPSLTEAAYAQLEERIVTLKLPPGSVLSEASLIETLGIGRTPIREALQQLAREGLVVILPRRGIVVSEINVQHQLELLRLRREVERLMVRLAAQRASAEERKNFQRIATGMKKVAKSKDDLRFMRFDSELNAALNKACRNEYVRRAMSLVAGLSRRFWYVHFREVSDLPLCARLHAAIAEAVGQSDDHQAAVASDSLMDYVETFTRASLDSPSGGALS